MSCLRPSGAVWGEAGESGRYPALRHAAGQRGGAAVQAVEGHGGQSLSLRHAAALLGCSAGANGASTAEGLERAASEAHRAHSGCESQADLGGGLEGPGHRIYMADHGHEFMSNSLQMAHGFTGLWMLEEVALVLGSDEEDGEDFGEGVEEQLDVLATVPRWEKRRYINGYRLYMHMFYYIYGNIYI